MRAFIALPIPDMASDALVRVQDRLGTGRPVPEANLHLTLAFLDDCSDEVLDEIHLGLESLAAPAPLIRFTGLSVYPATRQRLVVAEVAPDPDLGRLQEKVTAIARAAGAALPRRRFRPHVTLTRGRVAPTLPAGCGLDLPAFRASVLGLYRSTLLPGGARHDLLQGYPLRVDATGVPSGS